MKLVGTCRGRRIFLNLEEMSKNIQNEEAKAIEIKFEYFMILRGLAFVCASLKIHHLYWMSLAPRQINSPDPQRETNRMS